MGLCQFLSDTSEMVCGPLYLGSKIGQHLLSSVSTCVYLGGEAWALDCRMPLTGVRFFTSPRLMGVTLWLSLPQGHPIFPWGCQNDREDTLLLFISTGFTHGGHIHGVCLRMSVVTSVPSPSASHWEAKATLFASPVCFVILLKRDLVLRGSIYLLKTTV